MTRQHRILAIAALAGGLALASAGLAQPTDAAAPPAPPPPRAGAEAQGFPIDLLGGPGGPRPPRGPRGPMIDFVAIDTNGDGLLSRDELMARATGRLATADANRDGALDRDELIAAMPAPRDALLLVFAPDPAAERADRLIAFMGATESGRIEIAALADRQVNAILAGFDLNRDGSISQQEAARPAHPPRKGGPDHPGHRPGPGGPDRD